jgi:hypothetical protein
MNRIRAPGYWPLLMAAALLLAGCPSPSSLVTVSPLPTPTAVAGTTLPFETILQGEDSSYLGVEPFLFLIDDPEDAAQLLEYLALYVAPDRREAFTAQVQSSVYTPNVIALFRGRWGSSGYEVNIERVVQQGDELHVYAEFWKPGPRYPVTGAETSSYHVIKLLQPVENADRMQLVLHSYPMIHQ